MSSTSTSWRSRFKLSTWEKRVLGGFAPRFSEELVNDPGTWTQTEFLATFVFAFVPLWILAALAMSYKIPIVNAIGNYFAWFYALGAGLTNAIAHFVFPIITGGYFPGLYTAPFHLIMSIDLGVGKKRIIGSGNNAST